MQKGGDGIKICLLGFGTVGQGFVQAYEANEQNDISAILVRNPERYKHLKQNFVVSFEDILSYDPDVIIEVIGGIREAYTYVKAALKKGIHIITANKDLLAEHGLELFELASKHKVNLKYEAAVGGGIPIINAINTYHASEEINRMEGILNGTSNYILTQMDLGDTFESALKKAQINGFAEANPASDVEGLDPARKLSVLALTVFHQMIDWHLVRTFDLKNLPKAWHTYARQHGLKIKLVVTLFKDKGRLYGDVSPQMLSSEHIGYSVDNENNYISLKTNRCNETTYIGKGAGKLPTGYAVYSDYKNILKSQKIKLKTGQIQEVNEDALYLIEKNSKLAYESVSETLGIIHINRSELRALNIQHIEIRR